jgi:NADH-quinone oxidoreductase subunit M
MERMTYKNAGAFYGLMLLAQCGLMGVFLAKDACLFYFFWELALIPVYFLWQQVGRRKRGSRLRFKFFVYTFRRIVAHAHGHHLCIPAYGAKGF